jgi:hypothetical protein
MRSGKERDGMKTRAEADVLMAKCEEKARVDRVMLKLAALAPSHTAGLDR